MANIYYVSKSGNNSWDGTQPAYVSGTIGPWLTLAHAATSIVAGDTVQIRGGTYQAVSTWSVNGTEANPITITNYPTETPVIDGNNWAIPADMYPLLQINGDWYTVSNLEIRYSGGYGLIVADGADYCTIDNIYTHHNWEGGISHSASYGLINNCRAYSNSMVNENYQHPSSWSTGISICRTPTNSTIRGCTSWNNWGEGISTYEAYYTTIEDCIAYNNQINFYLSDTQHSTLRRSISYFTPGNPIQGYYTQAALYMGDETASPASTDNTVVNNFFLGGERNMALDPPVLINCLIAYNTSINADSGGDFNVLIYAGAASNSQFKNNIVLQEDSVTMIYNGATSGLTFSYNCWGETAPANCQGTGDVVGDPKLAKTPPSGAGTLTANYFKILSDSPAINHAQVLAGVTQDYWQTERGGSPDMGGHEYQASSNYIKLRWGK